MAIPSSLSLVQLHSGQMKVFQSPHRFKVVCAGRRWGKSRLSISTIIRAAAKEKSKGSGMSLLLTRWLARFCGTIYRKFCLVSGLGKERHHDDNRVEEPVRRSPSKVLISLTLCAA